MDRVQTPINAILSRGVAYIIDCTICFVGVFLILQMPLLYFRPMLGIDYSWFDSGLNTQIYTLTTISLPVWLYFSLMESSNRQRTFGKAAVGLVICDRLNDGRLRIGHAFVRTAIKLLPWELVHIGNNLPTPIWFTDEPGFRIAFLFAGLLMPSYLVMILINENRQGPHDLIVGSIVIPPKPRTDKANPGVDQIA